ncbi:autotransporter-associated beta strand repeat-containing protein [Ferruginibacter paludis]|uniref:beta strand repeat-containing protein n=1 Tax=Ferruginibacter paludis TaxID=1310417 RepID=UPI0025B2D78C|nr:autotransporter-associated beta strand repeat-containing protein [Ferruginibacter paludis]MDN3655891.1 autotransporter-associated beta strand repeat-containing protein [Ferruginibacter paludis]
MKTYIFLPAVGLLLCICSSGQTNNYFGASGILNGNVWSTAPVGPYTAALNTSGGAIIYFNNPAPVTGGTITVAGINANANVSAWANGGTLGTGGTVIPITVGAGAILNMNQAVSTAGGTGFNKTGTGTLVFGTGGNYSGGFTLTAGTMVVNGINAMGATPGNTLTLNGGTLCSTGNMALAAKYPGGITIGGNVQFGETAAPAAAAASLIFSDNIDLGNANRTLTLGNAGTVSFGGIISNSAPAGISFSANSNGSGLFDITNAANTFSGPVNLNGGEVRFAADGSFGNPANVIVMDGGVLRTNATFTLAHNLQLGPAPGTAINTPAGNLTISGTIADKSGAGNLIKKGAGILTLTGANTFTGTTMLPARGGTLQLNKIGGNTIPATNDVVVNGGVLQISRNQTLNNMSLVAGNITVDNGVTLTINGTLDYFPAASITLTGSGKIAYGPAGILKYSGNNATIISAEEWPLVNVPATVICNNSAGVALPITGSVTGSLVLSAGTFTIGAGGLLDLNGADLIVGTGTLAGNASADFTVRGVTGGTVVLPSNISLKNVTVGGTRTLALNGTSNLTLSGSLLVDAGAVFDNGGESQVIYNGGFVTVSGTFINRDKDNFTGTNGAIPGVTTTLMPGSTVEYALAGNQVITKRDDYNDVVFSGGGVKALANACSPAGTVFIKGNTTVDAGIHVFGNLLTSLSMDNGRLILRGTSNPQPHMGGTYNLTGGVVQFDCNSASGQTIRSETYKNIETTGLYTGNSNGNITLSSNGTFTVKTGSVFEMNDNAIIGPSGIQTVTVETGATFKCGNALGFNGPLSGLNSPAIRDNIETIILQPGSTVNYSRSNPPQVSGDQSITNTIPYQHLVIAGSAGIKTAPAGILTVKGDFIKTGTPVFAHNNGTVLLNGGNQSFAGLPYNNLLLDNTGVKTLTGNASIADSIQISNLLTTPATELSLGENYITLLSGATNTARVGAIPDVAGVKINYGTNGRFVIERYYPPKRAWRLITAPVTADASTGTIFNSWQNRGLATSQSGTFITGKNPAPAVNGLDPSPFNNSSLKTFNAATQLLEEVTNTRTQLISGTTGSADNRGYFIFVRGDRSTNNLFNPPFANATVLRDTGKILIKNQSFTFSGLTPGAYYLAGNPYASPVYASRLVAATTGINNGIFYTWDPNLNAQHGGYIAMTYSDVAGGNWIATPPSPVGKQDSIIQSGQAFFVQAAAPSATIAFTEADKWRTGNPAVFRPLGGSVPAGFSLRTDLYLLNTDSTTTLADGILAEYSEGYNNGIDYNDAAKMPNLGEVLALYRQNKSITVERRSVFAVTDTLVLNLTRTTARSYQFVFTATNIDPLVTARLSDKYTGASTPINTQGNTQISFTITGEKSSAAPDRFRIVLTRSAKALAIISTSISAEKLGQTIQVSWKVENETGISRYAVQKSLDGVIFNTLRLVKAAGKPIPLRYAVLDENPVAGNNFYRVQTINQNGEATYTATVALRWQEKEKDMLVYPNPVTNYIINLHFLKQPAGAYLIKMYSETGQLIMERKVDYNGFGRHVAIALPADIACTTVGLLQIVSPDNRVKMLKITMR